MSRTNDCCGSFTEDLLARSSIDWINWWKLDIVWTAIVFPSPSSPPPLPRGIFFFFFTCFVDWLFTFFLLLLITVFNWVKVVFEVCVGIAHTQPSRTSWISGSSYHSTHTHTDTHTHMHTGWEVLHRREWVLLWGFHEKEGWFFTFKAKRRV